MTSELFCSVNFHLFTYIYISFRSDLPPNQSEGLTVAAITAQEELVRNSDAVIVANENAPFTEVIEISSDEEEFIVGPLEF